MAVGAALSAWAGAVAWRDARAQRIPNALLLAAIVPAGAVLLLTGQGLAGGDWIAAAVGSALTAALTFPGYALRQLGAGDVKFAVVGGFILGAWRGGEMLIIAALALGLASAWIVARGRAAARHRRLAAGPALALGLVVELAGGPWLL